LYTSTLCHIFSSYDLQPPLHPFPTRRSSDLAVPGVRYDPRRLRPRRAGLGPRAPPQGPARTGRAWIRAAHALAHQVIAAAIGARSEEHTSELQSRGQLVWRLLLGKKERESVR